MLTTLHLREKNRWVCIKKSKLNSSLACIHGQVTKHTTVKWPAKWCSVVKASADVSVTLHTAGAREIRIDQSAFSGREKF